MGFGRSEFSAAETEAVRLLVGRCIASVEREQICATLLQRRGRGVPEPNL